MQAEIPGALDEVESLSSLIVPEHVTHLLGRIPSLPICTPTDLANIERAKRGLHPDFLPHTPQNNSGYAWQRHPRYVAEYEISLERFISENPFQAIIWVDEASAITLLKSLAEATWLRDCGDRVQRSFSEGLYTRSPNAHNYSHLKQATAPKDSSIRRALASYAQIALYTIPLEMSRNPDDIRRYLVSSIGFMSTFARHRLRTGHERRREISGRSEVTKASSSMEELWRVDTTLYENPDRQTLLEMLSSVEHLCLDPKVAEETSELFKLAQEVTREGDRHTAEQLRAYAKDQIQKESTCEPTGISAAADYIADMSVALAGCFIDNGYASPAAFFSIDMAPPTELVRRARSTLDIETLASGVYRRAEERLLRGDPTHIVGSVSEARRHFPDGSVMFSGNFEGTDFYRKLPSSLKDLRGKIEEATEDFRERVRTLHKGGVCASFPWDVVVTEQEKAAMTDPDESKNLKRIRERFLEGVLRNIQGMQEGEAVRKWHTLKEIFSWMTPEEAEHLVNFSPVFKKYKGLDPETTKVPVLIFTKTI